MKQIHCFFSGGRDSALTCFIAYQVAQRRRWEFKLVHIDTTIAIKQTREYVRRYAEWLGTELIVLRPKKTFKEYAAQYGMWPAIYPTEHRWCYFRLKLDPSTVYLKESYRKGDIVALGVRGPESGFRLTKYTAAFFTRDYGKLEALVWAPLWRTTDEMVERLIRRFNIPRNPVWRFGFSGECLCLAGSPLVNVALVLRYFPEEAQELLEIDKIINRNRRSGKPSAPFRVWQAGYQTLQEFYERVVKPQTTLDEFILPYTGKTCQGSCLLL
jgi:3'-phosphoadenosine 5'-phosphosulfate sulfotransferase (PAPS reductase)/FAD synthetase